ncbi:DUF3263 domain-containing protein [Microbacterium imperiale]|uniref:DUF3263 domain-containing protein n=1 Tax=Microbacterium imperiale TaxID=33884 RepID=A0A9W6HF40_9MICO|nr:DUF3263 domain-containing protein [Microbacterium imperiale]MBP2419980.1 hypothetical protein [Microbacterium imperiale]MDS0198156.1 DUF3263 domain-containing protein [Microbacterium imperiale]BFE40322.1 hypothetical protein GCM10017544_12780 [Microbacterium imperiale]GLJ78702.1 hypothetical protein GCM10017586_03840 [Microbacterium imperiale]
MPTTAELLDFEAAHPTWTGEKDELCVSELGLRPARYYVLLHRAVETREALEHDPVTTHRVLDRIERRARERRLRAA